MKEFAKHIITTKKGYANLFFLGQAGFILRSKTGKLLGIDLYLSDCVEKLEGHIGFKRLQPKLLEASDLKYDYLIATHPHYDHLDVDSAQELIFNCYRNFYASVNCEQEIKSIGIGASIIKYVKPGDSFADENFTIDIIKCDHGTSAPDAFGCIVETAGKRIVFVGDTCLRTDWKDEYLKKGPIDILVAPINGAYGNLSETDCAQLSKMLSPRLTIPCHFGMFASHGGNPEKFMSEMKKICPNNKYTLMAMGDYITL